MDLDRSLGESSEMFEAQINVYKHVLNYANSMALYCCLKLGIPDVIHDHGKPVTLIELVSKLNIPNEKTLHLKRLMRLLIHSNFFYVTKFLDQDDEDEKEGYVITLASKLLLKSTSEKSRKLPSLLSFAKLMLDPEFISNYWRIQGNWFKGNEPIAFESCIGEFANKNPKFNKLFNEAIESNSKMMNFVVKDNKEMFEGLDSLVDVGGGTGIVAKIILETFPHMNCIVLDQPHVVAGMIDSTNLSYVGGDMFSSIPHAEAIILKNVLHDWSDEEVLKLLDKCKESISFAGDDGKQRKVIIIEMVIDDHDRHDILAAKLLCDVIMMFNLEGKERTEDEWMQLFFKAGFSRYKITRTYGLMSIIEIFP